MHLYVLARADILRLNRWVNDCQAQYFPWKLPKGYVPKVRLSIRPVQMYEIVFPENALTDVLKTVMPYDDEQYYRVYRTMLRKFMRLEKIPFVGEPNNRVNKHNVHVMGIGLKKDRYKMKSWEQI